MTILKSLFYKPIDRPIDGVIKADDEARLFTEVDEYVLTNEVAKYLEFFLEQYHHYENKNGAWISGFFGSGKSHLLKMLALLLENRRVDDLSVIDSFIQKCEGNALLQGNLRRVAQIPSKSVLFNIDAKADVSKSQADALLAVFVRVFDEMCGYFGKQPYIAQFERDLDNRGQLQAFQAVYQEIAGQSWAQGREVVFLEEHNVAEAYARVAGGISAVSAEALLEKYRQEYTISIEDFAKQVNDYIERQGKTFRLNFFVDEVGQYIADNTKLMTNLQSVAETLATHSRGRAWIIVTSQGEMQAVLGELKESQQNDFSKIQARFAIRFKLTSTDVAEVIQRRLLAKNEKGQQITADLYRRYSGGFKSLFDFHDDSRSYRNFRDETHFIHSYPFVPYQYELFQSAIEQLSVHGAFEGKHSSVGERSMLGVFQTVAKQIAACQVGELATFDLMFDGIQSSLKSQIQRSVQSAEKTLDNPLAIRLLKALFLVKYVKEFKPSLNNISILLLPHFECDIAQHREKIQEALTLLESQTYIQRNNKLYEFLTDEEKDVEQEIKSTQIPSEEYAKLLHQLIFTAVLPTTKIRNEAPAIDYPFSVYIDDHAMKGQQQELAFRIITPMNPHFEDATNYWATLSMGRDELVVRLPDDPHFISDLLLYCRTEKYIKEHTRADKSATIQAILNHKGQQNAERRKQLDQQIKVLLVDAALFINGSEIYESSSDGNTRLTKGFQRLISVVYTNLSMLRHHTYQEREIDSYLNEQSALVASAELNQAAQELFNKIQFQQKTGERTTLQQIVRLFETKPYGWHLPTIQCLLAQLWVANRIEARQDSNTIDDKIAFAKLLHNTKSFDHVIITPQEIVDVGRLRKLKTFYQEFFLISATSQDAKSLAQEFSSQFTKMNSDLQRFYQQRNHYPFLRALEKPIKRIEKFQNLSIPLYDELLKQANGLLDMREDVIAPIFEMMNGDKKTIFDEIRHCLQGNTHNINYLAQEVQPLHQTLQAVIDDPLVYQSNRLQQAKIDLQRLQKALTEQIDKERRKAEEEIGRLWQSFQESEQFARLTPAQQADLKTPFAKAQEEIGRLTQIAQISETERLFWQRQFPPQWQKMEQMAAPPVPTADAKVNEVAVRYDAPKPVFLNELVRAMKFRKPILDSGDDVDGYLDALKERLLQQIKEGKQIQL